ncbi:MAG: hypothetical protein FWG99_08550 [Treponema sp.]|nr:hypothetical protein [Treponema sp.]
MKQNTVKGYSLEKLRKLPVIEYKNILKDFTIEELDLLYENTVPPRKLSKIDKDLIRFRYLYSPDFSYTKRNCEILMQFNNKLEETLIKLIKTINDILELCYKNSIYNNIYGQIHLKFITNKNRTNCDTGIYAFINKYIEEYLNLYILVTPNNKDYDLYCEGNYSRKKKYLLNVNIPYLKQLKLEEQYIYFMPETLPSPLPDYIKNTIICRAFVDFLRLKCFSFWDLLKINVIDFDILIKENVKVWKK